MDGFFHSVTLDDTKCKGCTNCIKRCPTGAIRVRKGKAYIRSERCIDCGECVRVCPYKAKSVVCDSLELMKKYRYIIALPAPALYGQFRNLDNIDYVQGALLKMGFDSVFEVGKAAEIISGATRRLLKENKNLELPLLSTACPAVVRLIRVKYPHQCDQMLPLMAPMHLAGRMAKEEAQRKTGLELSEIGAFFITPCPAKVTDIASPIGTEVSSVDGAFSMAEIYPRLFEHMHRSVMHPPPAQCGIIGVSWASSGGEAAALINDQYIAADGIENVITVLDQLEDNRLSDLEFIELNACPGGCVGGVLTVENPFVAKARIHQLRKYLPVSLNHFDDSGPNIEWDKKLEYAGVLSLSDNIIEAMGMLQEVERLEKLFPGLDCGSCGSPSCRTLAEDIVTGHAARLNDCIFILRQEAETAGLDVSKEDTPK